MKNYAVDGRWIEDTVHLGQSKALQFGAGLFETILIRKNVPLFWNAHMARLTASAEALGLGEGLDTGKLEEWTKKLLRESPQHDSALKITWLQASGAGMALFHFRPAGYTAAQRQEGLKAALGQIRRNPYSRVTAHKTLNYLDNLLERQAARAAGYDEALLMNVRGEMAEATAANLFIRMDGNLITPPLDAGILPGIQRQAIITACRQNGIPLEERAVYPEMLRQAEGIYLSNSLMGFLPVSNFMGNCYDKDEGLVSRINRLTGVID